MAHIRQILANLSISVSDFKKNPKTIIKAVRTEPIAVIINNKPAFYCVPADILESLYQKFYEMNDISLQHLQELSTDSSVVEEDDDNDDSFGVTDIFQSIEDEQDASLTHPDSIVDPISADVADPLDDEVAEQLSQFSTETHPIETVDDKIEEAVEHSDLNNEDDIEQALNSQSFICKSGSDLDNAQLNKLPTNDELNNCSFDNNCNLDDLMNNSENHADNLLLTENDYALLKSETDKENRTMKKLEDKAALREVIRDVKQELQDSQHTDSIVRGPNSFSLEHVAKTYSPYYNSTLKKGKHKEVKGNNPLSSCVNAKCPFTCDCVTESEHNIHTENTKSEFNANSNLATSNKHDVINSIEHEGETIKDLHDRLVKNGKQKKNKNKHKKKNKDKSKSIFF